MLQIEKDRTMQPHDAPIFLSEAEKIPELDDWIAEYLRNERRFTFTEADVLQLYWDQGEDILLREDCRFQEAALPDFPFPEQWQLSIHTIANQFIYDVLLNDEWDGEDLCLYLRQLDQQQTELTFHIFCLSDKRFSISQKEEGCYHISLNQEIVKTSLSAEQKDLLDSFAAQLLEAFPDQGRTPWTTTEILEQIKHVSSSSLTLEHLTPATIAQWLRRREEWAKVGQDLWFPLQFLPPSTQNRRYAVLSVNTGKMENSISLLNPADTDEQSMCEAVNQEVSEDQQPQDSQQTTSSTLRRKYVHDRVQPEKARDANSLMDLFQPLSTSPRWKVALRTLHLNEGYIPVPPQERAFYPHDQKLNGPFALPGIWFADASEMTVWLDTTHHRLYGPDIMDQLAFLDAGTIVEVFWSNAGLTFNLVGHDPEILEEEARLIDLTELAQLRATVMESYRVSLRTLLASTNQGKSFAELYRELCERQQHKPNRSTIRAILSSSPEFLFEKSESKWKLQSEIPEEAGASTLRKLAVTAQQVVNKESNQPSEAVSLTTMIARNREQLIYLRQLYSASSH